MFLIACYAVDVVVSGAFGFWVVGPIWHDMKKSGRN